MSSEEKKLLAQMVQQIVSQVGSLLEDKDIAPDVLVSAAQSAVLDASRFQPVIDHMLPVNRDKAPIWSLRIEEAASIIMPEAEADILAELRSPVDFFACDDTDEKLNWITIMGFLGNPLLRTVLYTAGIRTHIGLLKRDPSATQDKTTS